MDMSILDFPHFLNGPVVTHPALELPSPLMLVSLPSKIGEDTGFDEYLPQAQYYYHQCTFHQWVLIIPVDNLYSRTHPLELSHKSIRSTDAMWESCPSKQVSRSCWKHRLFMGCFQFINIQWNELIESGWYGLQRNHHIEFSLQEQPQMKSSKV